ncbi:MAG TPA: hypothetical protein VGM05_06305 [Planctomycetaceae bacterium]|jgi:uncharacterized membrane protein (DUF485 family)
MPEEREFSVWRKTLSAIIGAAMFLAFVAMCFFATKSWLATVAFGAVTLGIHFAWNRRARQ